MGAGHQADPPCDQRVGLGASANISLQGVGWRVRELVQAQGLRAHQSYVMSPSKSLCRPGSSKLPGV